MAKKIERIVFIVVGVILVAWITWGLTTAGPGSTAQAAMNSDDLVTVVREGNRFWFCPAAPRNGVGLIFYPGGHVDYRSYSPILRKIAEGGSVVVVQRMPLSLAVLASGRAKDSFAETFNNPCKVQIEAWYIGGHSLGGAMAALYADTHPKQISGLVLWAAYPAEGNDLNDEALRVLSVYATNDGLATEEKRTAVAGNLPASTTYVEITGGNHAQFGDYGQQSGDGIATITAQYQWDWVAFVTGEFINKSGQ